MPSQAAADKFGIENVSKELFNKAKKILLMMFS